MAERAQTAIDFAVAMGVFLLAVAFVLAFVPSMFAPFFGHGVGDTVTADRAAATVIDGHLSEGGTPVLNETATRDFFSKCETSSDLTNKLSFGSEAVYLVILDEADPLLLDEDTDAECGTDDGGPETVAQRIVSFEGQVYELRVKVF